MKIDQIIDQLDRAVQRAAEQFADYSVSVRCQNQTEIGSRLGKLTECLQAYLAACEAKKKAISLEELAKGRRCAAKLADDAIASRVKKLSGPITSRQAEDLLFWCKWGPTERANAHAADHAIWATREGYES